jgi:hypothetical protein
MAKVKERKSVTLNCLFGRIKKGEGQGIKCHTQTIKCNTQTIMNTKDYEAQTWVLSLCCLILIEKISEQSCSNGEPERHTGMWEGIRTTHKLIFRVPHGSRPHGHDRNLALCVNDPASWRTLVSWDPRHMETPPTSNVNCQLQSSRNTRGFWGSELVSEGIIHHGYTESKATDSCEDTSGIRYWYSSPWNPGHITWVWGGPRE